MPLWLPDSRLERPSWFHKNQPKTGRFKLNKSHPLAKNLIGCWVGFGSHPIHYNLADGQYGTKSGTYAEKKPTKVGMAAQFNDSFYFKPADFDKFNIDDEVTVTALLVDVAGSDGSYRTICAKSDRQYHMQILFSTNEVAWVVNDGSWYSLKVGFSAGETFIVSGVFGGTTSRIYKNGAAVGSVTAGISQYASYDFFVAHNAEKTGRLLGDKMVLLYVHHKALSAIEIQQLHADPYQIFELS